MLNKQDELKLFLQLFDSGKRVPRGTFTDSAQKQRYKRFKKDRQLGIKKTNSIPNPDNYISSSELSFSDSEYEDAYSGFSTLSKLEQDLIKEGLRVSLSKKEVSSSSIKMLDILQRALLPQLFIISSEDGKEDSLEMYKKLWASYIDIGDKICPIK